jgi:hypothetical protein
MLHREDADIWLLRTELEQMESFLDLLHTAINDSKEQFNASIEKEAKTIPEDQSQDFYEAYADDFIELDADFPRLLLSSFIVSWYSFMEDHLISFCRSRKFKTEDKETHGWSIRHAYNFLQKTTGKTIDKDHWDELNRIREVRNIIVHSHGKIHYSPYEAASKTTPVNLDGDVTLHLKIKKSVLDYLQINNLFEPRGLFFITPTLEYCKYLVKFGKELLLKLHKDFRT